LSTIFSEFFEKNFKTILLKLTGVLKKPVIASRPEGTARQSHPLQLSSSGLIG
jgi:hypothetical protein